jgi:hypothetical protein
MRRSTKYFIGWILSLNLLLCLAIMLFTVHVFLNIVDTAYYQQEIKIQIARSDTIKAVESLYGKNPLIRSEKTELRKSVELISLLERGDTAEFQERIQQEEEKKRKLPAAFEEYQKIAAQNLNAAGGQNFLPAGSIEELHSAFIRSVTPTFHPQALSIYHNTVKYFRENNIYLPDIENPL